jgi:hypothetical protein
MAFFEFMKRMVEGRPAFEDNAQEAHQAVPSSPDEQQPMIRKGDDTSFPVVRVVRVTTHFDGGTIQIYCHILNTWNEEVELTKISLLDTQRVLGTHLRAGEERELLVYNGPALQRQVYEAQLEYKTHAEKDYFKAVHDVTFTYHPADKTYTIDEMRLHPPIRDIYE